MGRAPCCSKVGLHRGPWNAKEDALLVNYIRMHGEGQWRNLPERAGLLRCGKSCRLRWLNYLRPDIKRGNISSDEDDLIIRLHSLLGNRWSLIAKRLPGRTDNEIKNYWNSHLSKRAETSTESDDDHQPKASRAVKKRSKSTNEKDHKKNKEDSPRTKIYLPKAVRVSPYWTAIRNIKITSGSTSLSGHGEGNNIRPNDTDVPLNTPAPCWTEFIEEEAARGNEDCYGLGNTCDTSFPDFVPADDKMLDEIINEYQQLLDLGGNVQLD